MVKIFIILLLVQSLSAHTQNKTVDSLKRILQTQTEDTNRVNTLNTLSDKTRNINVDSSIQYAEDALSLSEKLSFKKGKANALHKLGVMQEFQSMHTQAMENILAALKLFKDLGNNQKVASCYDAIGEIYLNQSNYHDAHTYKLEALKIREALKDKKGIALSYLNLGQLFFAQNSFSEAMKHGYIALQKFEDLMDKENMAFSQVLIAKVNEAQSNYKDALGHYEASLKLFEEMGIKPAIASAHKVIGDLLLKEGDYEGAMEKNLDALKIYKEWGAVDYVAWAYMGIGDILEKEGINAYSIKDNVTANKKLNEALKNYYQAREIYEQTKNKDYLAVAYSRLGSVHINLKKLKEARAYFNKSLQFSGENISQMEHVYLYLAYIDSAEGSYKQAYTNYKLHVLYRDSLFNEESTKKSLQAKMEYEYDKKQAITKAEQDRKDAETKRIKNLQYAAIAGLGTVMLAVLLIAFILWRNNKHKQIANLLLKEQKEKVEVTLSELKATQTQLIQSEKMASLGELTAGIAHEIQNPLNFVNNFSEVNKELLVELKEEIARGNVDEVKALASDITENEEKINHHGKRADAIVKSMLQHSRSSHGVKETTDINALTDEYLKLAYHGLRAKDISFSATTKTNYDKTIGSINIIPQDIGRVILNLITNAFYAVTEKKKQINGNYEPIVLISTKRAENKIEITVADNGNGIPQKILDKIFQPFFTTKPTGQGTGLGLSLSYDIIKAHGGEIKVETKEGEGTEFTVQLPS